MTDIPREVFVDELLLIDDQIDGVVDLLVDLLRQRRALLSNAEIPDDLDHARAILNALACTMQPILPTRLDSADRKFVADVDGQHVQQSSPASMSRAHLKPMQPETVQ